MLWKALPESATLHFWRSSSKAEVDFVVVRGDLVVGVEVKARRLGRPQLQRSSRSFIDAYRPYRFFVVSSGLLHQETVGDTSVQWINPEGIAAAVSEVFVSSSGPGR